MGRCNVQGCVPRAGGVQFAAGISIHLPFDSSINSSRPEICGWRDIAAAKFACDFPFINRVVHHFRVFRARMAVLYLAFVISTIRHTENRESDVRLQWRIHFDDIKWKTMMRYARRRWWWQFSFLTWDSKNAKQMKEQTVMHSFNLFLNSSVFSLLSMDFLDFQIPIVDARQRQFWQFGKSANGCAHEDERYPPRP